METIVERSAGSLSILHMSASESLIRSLKWVRGVWDDAATAFSLGSWKRDSPKRVSGEGVGGERDPVARNLPDDLD